jgi:hypothetical protein
MIFVECDADKILVSSLGVKRKEIKHANSKGNVCNQLQKRKRSKGLIDEDPGSAQPSYVSKLETISAENNIKVLYERKTHNYLIVLCPRLEEWILQIMKDLKIDLREYNLPEDSNNFHRTISLRSEAFARLVIDIKKSKKLQNLRRLLTSKS